MMTLDHKRHWGFFLILLNGFSPREVICHLIYMERSAWQETEASSQRTCDWACLKEDPSTSVKPSDDCNLMRLPVTPGYSTPDFLTLKRLHEIMLPLNFEMFVIQHQKLSILPILNFPILYQKSYFFLALNIKSTLQFFFYPSQIIVFRNG